MMNHPMCCPNSVHNESSNPDEGMDIIVEPDTDDVWYCMDCKKNFRYFNVRGETRSEMIRMPNERASKR